MGKAKMLGAFAPYTPNSKADMRYRRNVFERQKQIADNATPKQQRKLDKKKEDMYGC